MDRIRKPPELLSPAGDFEKLEAALHYGADAVYLAGKHFGMRSASSNFTDDELEAAVLMCHSMGRKLYVTVNIMPHTNEYDELRRFVKFLSEIKADAAIVSDVGVVSVMRELAPDVAIHISTQASCVSAEACRAWHALGASRVVLARELTLSEIREICDNVPDSLEIETFVHGSMCVSYSGRCLLSNYFTGRDANRGACAQTCRWKYTPAAVDLFEDKRGKEHALTAEEDPNGETFFMSSRDLCMIEHIPELEEAGISSYKIEGRVKSSYYTAVVTNVYRMALDLYRSSPADYSADPKWLEELDGVSHREYGTGFFFAPPAENANTVTKHGYMCEKAYLAIAVRDALTPDADGKYRAEFYQKNKMFSGERIELLTPGRTGASMTCSGLQDMDGNPIDSTPHPLMRFTILSDYPVMKGDMLRRG